MALLFVRAEGGIGVMPDVEQPDEVVHGKVAGHFADDLGVRVGDTIGEVRTAEEAHIGPAVRELRPSSAESCCTPVDDAANTAALPEDVARMEVPVREDALGR